MSLARFINKARGDMHRASEDGETPDSVVNELIDYTVQHVKLVDGSAGATLNTNIGRVKKGRARIVSVEFVPDATLTAHDTNYATLTLNKGTAGSLDAAATVTTKITGGTGDWVADTPEALTLSSTEANLLVASGDNLNFDIAKASSGVAVPAGCLVVTLRPY